MNTIRAAKRLRECFRSSSEPGAKRILSRKCDCGSGPCDFLDTAISRSRQPLASRSSSVPLLVLTNSENAARDAEKAAKKTGVEPASAWLANHDGWKRRERRDASSSKHWGCDAGPSSQPTAVQISSRRENGSPSWMHLELCSVKSRPLEPAQPFPRLMLTSKSDKPSKMGTQNGFISNRRPSRVPPRCQKWSRQIKGLAPARKNSERSFGVFRLREPAASMCRTSTPDRSRKLLPLEEMRIQREVYEIVISARRSAQRVPGFEILDWLMQLHQLPRLPETYNAVTSFIGSRFRPLQPLRDWEIPRRWS